MARGINKEPIFFEESEKKILCHFIKKYLVDTNIEIYGYCIMNNHIHFLLKSSLEELSCYMKKMLSSYATFYNCKKERVGYVFQNRYKSECIETEEYFWTCLRYIHLNPKKVHLITNLSDYPYSSFGEYLNQENNIIHQNAQTMYQKYFQSAEVFLKFHNQISDDIFADVEEDVFNTQMEIAFRLLYKIQEKYGLQYADTVLELSESRKEYQELVCDILKISYYKFRRLFSELKVELGK